MKIKASEQIEQLRSMGYEVHVNHYRAMRMHDGLVGYANGKDREIAKQASVQYARPLPVILEKGGHTIVEIKGTKDDHFVYAKGESHCSKADNFSKNRGLTIALGRAIHSVKT